MEIGLGGDTIEGLIVLFKDSVLILVLVEIGLGGNGFVQLQLSMLLCLNPCFSGNRFGSKKWFATNVVVDAVLILVLVEIGLGAYHEHR